MLTRRLGTITYQGLPNDFLAWSQQTGLAFDFTVAITGGREFKDADLVWSVLDLWKPLVGCLVNGRAKRGVDYFAHCWAVDRGKKETSVFADWDQYGKAAGAIRNSEMLKLKPDFLLAFPGGSGTADMVAKATKFLPVVHVKETT